MNVKEQRILENLCKSMESEIGENSDLINNKIKEWVDTIKSINSIADEEILGFEQAKYNSNKIIRYLSKNCKNFNLMDLFEKCESAKIQNYDKILMPTSNNFIVVDNETITKIIKLYDKNFVIDKLENNLSIADKINSALDKLK